MKPVAFDYLTPSSVAEAVGALARAGGSAVALAGGQSLVPLLNARRVRPATVVDLNRLPELAECRIGDEVVRIGAMARLHSLAGNPELGRALPVLSEAVATVAHRQIRHRATLGGSMCHADPAAQLPAVAVALGARLRLRSATGARVEEAQSFFGGAFHTSRRPDELLVAVDFPVHKGFRFRFESVTRRGARGFPFVAACFGVRLTGSVISSARLAASGVADRPVRLAAAERALAGRALSDDLGDVLDTAAAEVDPPDDIHGSAAFRADLLRTVLRRAAARLTTLRGSR
ncbi:FAD binding domain-containing protein [Kutzneria sp. NPDC052558]|uniref:FAD binding domain-containing protein n=1 Tax=Kutzneria sp. NPDC052558 TaxID=3364121 RepID=UPI0037C57DA1